MPTGEQLTHRAFHGPTWCILCKGSSESTEHLFLRCCVIIDLWNSLANSIPYSRHWEGADLNNTWDEWPLRHKGTKLINLLVLVNWHIWKARNRNIFYNKPAHWPQIEAGIISAFKELPDPPPPKERRPRPHPSIDTNSPWAFFDGVANQNGCDGGFILYINEVHYYKVKLGLGARTNNYGELITLRHLFHFTLGHHCTNLNIFGDSKIIINWFNGISDCDIHTLSNILNEEYIFKATFNNISCTPIYREHNSHADKLSKEVALMPRGVWEITEQHGTNEYQYYHRPYIDQVYQRDFGH